LWLNSKGFLSLRETDQGGHSRILFIDHYHKYLTISRRAARSIGHKW